MAGLTRLKISARGTSTNRLSWALMVVNVPGGAWRTILARDILTEPVGKNRRMAGMGITTIELSGGIFRTSFRKSSGNFAIIASSCNCAVSTLWTPEGPWAGSAGRAAGTPAGTARTGAATAARGTATAIGAVDFLLMRLRRNRNMQP